MKYSPGKKRKLSKEQEVELVDIINYSYSGGGRL